MLTSNPSINNDPDQNNETIPITNPNRQNVSSSVFRRVTSAFRTRQTTELREDQGYVEFGGLDPAAESNHRTLGTFSGCFAPVSLSMFSALVFIRVGFLVGNAGLYTTLFQFLVAYLILVFTVCSVCAISTNGAIEGGGVYFMISRTLGPEFGGAIGSLFFLANVVGSALAITGCVEGLLQNFGPGGYLLPEGSVEGFLVDGRWHRFLYCSIINTLILLVVLIGAAMFAKTSASTLGIVVICLLSILISFIFKGETRVDIPPENNLLNRTLIPYLNYTGLSRETFEENLYPNYGRDYTSGNSHVNFAIVFGVLFSGVTGIMAGANMSGELKNPSKSIPTGTLSAVLFTFICYVLLCVLMAATSPSILLKNNFLFLMPVNVYPSLVAMGILTATFSTALSNLIGSSRVIEALAKDQVFGNWLNFIIKGTWNNNPIVAVILSWVLVESVLLFGEFNLIAQINSVLFMLSYMATNLACLCIEITGAVNFRPTFKYFTWHTAFLGLMGTLVMMFVINAIYASMSLVVLIILVIALHLFSPAATTAQWGSISQALMFHQVRKYLLMLDSRKEHVKFWRPQMLLLVASPRTSCPLIHFVNDMKKGGLYVIGHVNIGEFKDNEEDPIVEEYNQWLNLVDHMKVKAFVELTLAKNVREGTQHLIRIAGLGGMKINTVLLGFYDEEECYDFFDDENSQYQTSQFSNSNKGVLFPHRKKNEVKSLSQEEFVMIVSDILRMKKNVCLCRHFHKLNKSFISKSNHIKYIDLWPINIFDPTNNDPFDTASKFMMQLACIINMQHIWKNLQLRIFLVEFSENDQHQSVEQPAEYRLNQLLKQLRISATIQKIPEWNSNNEAPRNRSLLKNLTRNSENDSATMSEENLNRMKLHLQRINQMIRDYSNSTAVTFMYLPPPPNICANFKTKCSNYLDLLSELTYELPPTILVHGISTVTSTSL